MRPTIKVRLRVVDGVTKQPTPVRISIADEQGNWFVPFGYFPDFPVGRAENVGGQIRTANGHRSYFVMGFCEIDLPTGVPLLFRIQKGPAFESIASQVTLGSGQIALRFELRPREDFPASGWLCGDSRVQFLDPHAALFESEAEGVAITQLLVSVVNTPSQDGHQYRSAPYLSAFSGSGASLENASSLVSVNTLNTHPALGRVGLLNAHRPTFPLTFGDMDETDDWSVCDWCDQCHRKTGLVTWCDAFSEELGLLGGEALIAAILGKIDAFEITARPRTRSVLGWYYSLLNAGVRIPLVGGSGKDSNRTPVGEMRTWVRFGMDSRLQSWIEGVRHGEASISTGLPLSVSANDLPTGSVLRLPDPHQPIRVRSRRYSFDDARHQLVVNGNVIELNGAETEITLPQGGWICTRVVGDSGELCHSSPVYVEIPDQPPYCVPAAIHTFLTQIESVREWVRTVGRFEREKSREHLLQYADRAEAILQERLASAGV